MDGVESGTSGGGQQSAKVATWLCQPDVEDLVDLWIVRRDVEHVVGLILDARNIHGHQVFGDLLPAHGSGAAGADVEHFSPQSATKNSNKCVS